jgi:hypothetical protein
MRKYNYKFKRFLLVVAVFLLAACHNTEKVTTFVLLPDTQTYAEKYPEILHSQIDWITENAKDIDLVLQQGDLTQNNNKQEWTVVKEAFSKLNNRVPYVLAVGNHDMGSAPGIFADTRNTDLFNSFFPVETMSQLPAFGGFFEKDKMENVYYLFEKDKQKWLILSLEFGPRNEVLDWAGQISEQYSDRTVILNTHCYMYSDSTRVDTNDKWSPQSYGIGKDTLHTTVNNGEQIWNKLVKKHKNIRFVFSGHILNGGVGTLFSVNQDGWPVYQFLANYQSGVQGSQNGGNGFLRILKLNSKNHSFTVQTYSPYTNEFRNEERQSFTVKSVWFEQRFMNLKLAKQ